MPDQTKQLVADARAGCPTAEAQLFQTYYPLMISVARNHRLNPEDSADVAQVTWMKARKGLPTLRQEAKFPSWLRTIARNESIDVIRRRDREQPRADGGWSDRSDRMSEHDDEPTGQAIRNDEYDRLRAALTKLSDADRRLVELLFERDLPYSEISDRLGCPIGSIGPTRLRMLRRLRRLVELETSRSADRSQPPGPLVAMA